MISDLGPMLGSGTPTWVVPGGVDAAEFPPATDIERARSRSDLGIRPGELIVGFVGEFVTGRKGLELLLHALGPGHRLIVHGRGDREALLALARTLGKQDQIHIFDDRIHVSRSMTASDVVAIPSLYEPFSLVALEASSTAVPVIISERAGAAPFIKEAGAGLVISPTADALRQALTSVADPGQRQRMGERGRQMALEMSWDAMNKIAVEAMVEVARQNAR